MWGQAEDGTQVPTINGIIPTRVGTSLFYQVSHTTSNNHPHACGDKLLEIARKNYKTGSSPRVWGQEKPRDFTVIAVGIIPTRVGTRACH